MAAYSRLPLQLFLSTQSSRVISSRKAETATAKHLYPPVLPSRTAKSKSAKRRVLLEFFDQLRGADPQEKIRALTRIQRMKYVIYPQTFALGADKWYQCYTKTAYLSGLPEKFKTSAEVNTDLGPVEELQSVLGECAYSEIRSTVCNALLQENWYMKKGRTFLYREQEKFVAPFLANLVSGLVNSLVNKNPVLRQSSLDFDPQVNFYWVNGERMIPRGHRSGRIEPRRFQIDDKPHSQIRIPQQLPEFMPLEAEIPAEVPLIHLAPDYLPLFRRQYDNNISTGAKLKDPCQYGHTQFHLVPDKFHIDRLTKKNLADHSEVFQRANAIASLFAWTGAQAMYQGFWSEQDVSRPFTSQAVITDGKRFSFFCYQLNTLALSSLNNPDNPRKNVCWGTPTMCLYERLTDTDVLGWDDAVLKHLVQFLLNRPVS
ncbi:39S ribosomal protein S30, mitochondrial [Electrophorus electricus]|uniref:Mitochondrial ribosomal protein S30 n=1 Tax=Electrophorus electricus TaxID=8005 RepID=A0A4W4HFV6_ELEEL|nr:39S ribosomal protein S30, mitochondrial [Electrophorus electricus]